jgi:tRNA(Arg) A34 adenosine deaminase TadA
MEHHSIVVGLPDWLEDVWSEANGQIPSSGERMDFVIELARKNFEHGTGGPFGAAVFDQDGRLVAPGVNQVVPAHCSILHAEIVALALTEDALGRFDIGDSGRLKYELVSSTEPCAMCAGAILWSGISRLVCGARDEDARAIGFDEGPKLPSWVQEFEDREVEVVRDVRRFEAAAVLQRYAGSGGEIYNSGVAAI